MGLKKPEWRGELGAMGAPAVPVGVRAGGGWAQGAGGTIMVGKLGPAAIGAVALGNAVFYTPSLFGIGLLLGLDTLVAQAYGRKDYDGCHRWLAQGVYLAAFIAPVIMFALWIASYSYARVGIAPEVATPAGAYLRVLNW